MDSKGSTAQHVNIAPLDKTVFVGERWTFKCTVKPKVVIDTVRLRIVSTKSNFTWSVPPSDLKVLNKSTVSASVEIVDEFRVDPTVECLDGFGRVLRSGFFFVERPVQNITDFTGIYLYEKYVNMTWSLNQDYMKVEDIGVQLCWSDDRDFRSSRCGGSPLRYFVIDEADLNRKPYTIHVRVTVYHKHWNRRPVDMDSSTIILDTNATSEHRINMYNASTFIEL
ncbi:hypothetical protein Btru_057050 [Bulinus truncatus]|nr:hypothetical protein Btru_057050 [Bulinus truncatus]